MWFASLFGRRTVRSSSRRADRTRRPAHFRPRLEALEDRWCPSGGQLDPTFGGGTGEVTLPTSTLSLAQGVDVAIQSDGKIVAVGKDANAPNDIAVVRLNPNGSLDTTFNGTGYVDVKVGNLPATGLAVAIQPNGQILVGGSERVSSRSYTDTEDVVIRLNSNGSLDKTFGNDRGLFLDNPTSGGDQVSQLALLPDGSIIAAGSNTFKLTPSGQLDKTFGSGGFSPVSLTGTAGLAVIPGVDSQHFQVVEVGSLNGYGVVTVLNQSGQLDTSFNGTGYLDFTPSGSLYTTFNAVAIQGSQIVVAGSETVGDPNTAEYVYGLAARFNLSGTLDPTFGGSGTGYYAATNVVTPYGFKSLGVESDGSLVVGLTASYGVNYSDAEMAVGHLTANGTPDTSFGTAGTGFSYVTFMPYTNSSLFDLAINPNTGTILLVGDESPSGPTGFARLTAP